MANWFNVTKNGYRFDRRIAWGIMVIIFSLVFYLMYLNNFNFSETNIYIKCEDESCKNPLKTLEDCRQQLRILWVIPLYTAQDCRDLCNEWWCDEEFLPRGEYGEKPKGEALFNHIFLITVISIFIALFLNHFIHNRGKRFDIEIPFTKKRKLNIKEFLKKIGEKTEDKDN